MPFGLPIWLLGLTALALLGGGIYMIWAWYVGIAVGIGYLLAGVLMMLLGLFGRPIVLWVLRRPGRDEPKPIHSPESIRLARPDGSQLNVEFFGRPGAPTLVMTHGWGTNLTAWYYAIEALAGRFRLVVWDLPGLGRSRGPANHDYTVEKFAHDLDAVVEAARDAPVVLVGHSIGGMTIQSYCRLFPHRVGTRVKGLVLLNTTDEMPLRTAIWSPVLRALQKPLIEPVMHLTILLAPIAWLMNWLSYLNGSLHLLTTLSGYAGHETRGQLDYAARFTPLASPAVICRGGLGTFRYDERGTLASVDLPILVVTSEIDRVTIPQASQRIAETAPNASLVALSPGGHLSVLERPDAFGEIRDFAARCLETHPEAAQPALKARTAGSPLV